jgi:hypothetical protein
MHGNDAKFQYNVNSHSANPSDKVNSDNVSSSVDMNPVDENSEDESEKNDAPTRGNSAKSAEMLRNRRRNNVKRNAPAEKTGGKVKHEGKAYSKPFDHKDVHNADNDEKNHGYRGKKTLSAVLKENHKASDNNGRQNTSENNLTE